MNDFRKSAKEAAPSLDSKAWQERLREDANTLNNRIFNQQGRVKFNETHNDTRGDIVRATLTGGLSIGAGLAATESLINKEPVRFSRFALFAGPAGLACGLLSYLVKKDPKFAMDNGQDDSNTLQMCRDWLVKAYGEDTMKGTPPYQWYNMMQNHSSKNNGSETIQR